MNFEEINFEDFETVIVRENPKYVSDWNVTTEHSIQIKLLYKKHFVKAYSFL